MLNIILATFKKNRQEIKRALPLTLILGRITTGISTVVFSFFIYKYFLKGNLSESFLDYTNNSDYLTFIVLGAAMNILAISTLMNVGRMLITELREGTLDPFLLSPASRIGYFIGGLVEQLGRTFLEFIVIVILGTILGANISKILTIQTLFILLLSVISFFSMALVLSSFMLYTRDTYISQNTLFLSMTILCGVSFPIDYLPAWIQPLCNIFPMTAVLQLFRAVVSFNETIGANLNLVFQILLLSIVYFIISQILGKKVEKKLTENIFA